MRYLSFVIITMFIFVGCASEKVWYSQDKSIEQTKVDYKECQSYMLQQSQTPPSYNTPRRAGPPPGQYFDSCMAFKGYNLKDVQTLEGQGVEYYKVR